MRRWLQLALILTLFWVVFLADWYAFYGHGWPVGVVFGLTVVATLYTSGVYVAKHIESKSTERSVGLGLAEALVWTMVIFSIAFGVYFIVMSGVRLFA